MEMFVVQEKRENCSNSAFYRGQVAYARMANGRKLALQACGEVKFILPRDEQRYEVYGNNQASGGLEKMEISGITDADLPRDDRLWLHRNHFEIVKLSSSDDVVGDAIKVGTDYDEAMEQFLAYCVSINGR
jgi:hypothetical protein